jgi:hypothetical protein
MTFRTICAALLLSCLSIAGCGTVANLARPGPEGGGKVPFGGVHHDLQSIRTAADGGPISTASPTLETVLSPQMAHIVLCAADLPLSLLGDVVTWPYTCAYTWINQPVNYPAIILDVPPAVPTVPPVLPVVPPAAPVAPVAPANTPKTPAATPATPPAQPAAPAAPPMTQTPAKGPPQVLPLELPTIPGKLP